MKIIVENEQERNVLTRVIDAAYKFGGVAVQNDALYLQNAIVKPEAKPETDDETKQ